MSSFLTSYPSNAQIFAFTALAVAVSTVHYVYGFGLRPTFSSTLPKKSNTEIQSKDECKILSQNMWCLFFIAGRNRKARLQVFIDHIQTHKPDIICMQEMPIAGIGLLLLCGDFLFVAEKLAALGYVHYTDPLSCTPHIGSSPGLVIFSKYRILQTQTQFFKHRRWNSKCKGFQYAKIKAPNGKLVNIINLHLDPRDRATQFQQIEECETSNLWSSTESGDSYNLCTGDFNICSNSKYQRPYKYLCQHLSQGLALHTDLFCDTKRTWSTRKKRSGTRSLDHMFVNDLMKRNVIQTQVLDFQDDVRIASDHLALCVRVKLT